MNMIAALTTRLSTALLLMTGLQGARLEGADLQGVELFNVKLRGADLRWADLRHLNIDTAFEFVELTGVQLKGARFKNGVRCGSPPQYGWGCVPQE